MEIMTRAVFAALAGEQYVDAYITWSGLGALNVAGNVGIPWSLCTP
jgi:hypothetical protein